ncbi:hypothetical protein F2P81_005889 [Scophthalmus maximus]|uniref:Uncharacterized protein n=1 Tax=Scophthalmus maximus TaxID=52904 RepID=A0A6A4T7S7_SCOMX|nr:hypothetical protein F2P81_005889 [Scophthalmus maximus]
MCAHSTVSLGEPYDSSKNTLGGGNMRQLVKSKRSRCRGLRTLPASEQLAARGSVRGRVGKLLTFDS